mgnify:CR=1 FL=1
MALRCPEPQQAAKQEGMGWTHFAIKKRCWQRSAICGTNETLNLYYWIYTTIDAK